MSKNTRPAGANGPQATRSGQPSCLPHEITIAIAEQLVALGLIVAGIDKEHCYRAWELARIDYLNAQALAWQAGWRR